MRAGIALAAAVILLAWTSTTFAQSGANGGSVSGAFVAQPSLFSKLMFNSRPSSLPFFNLASSSKQAPAFSNIQNPMTMGANTTPQFRFFTVTPPKKK